MDNFSFSFPFGGNEDPEEMQKMFEQIFGENPSSFFGAMQGGLGNIFGGKEFNIESIKTEPSQKLKSKNTEISEIDIKNLENAEKEAKNYLKKHMDFAIDCKLLAISPSDYPVLTYDFWKSLVNPTIKNLNTRLIKHLGDFKEAEDGNIKMPPVSSISKFLTNISLKGLCAKISSNIIHIAENTLYLNEICMPSSEKPALICQSLNALAKDMQLNPKDLYLYCAIKEIALHSLFSHISWLKVYIPHQISLFANLTQEAINNQLNNLDPEAIEELMQNKTISFEKDPKQIEILDNLSIVLSLVHGWVEHIAYLSIGHTEEYEKISEIFRRRNIEYNLSALALKPFLKLDIDISQIKQAKEFWSIAYSKDGGARYWQSPDLLPEAFDLKDPQGFFNKKTDNFDEEIKKLFDNN